MAIAEVIKFEGPQEALVWKFPVEDFNATSQLIVDETHEALLVVNGNAADLFTAGRRTLSVPNIPIARSLIEIPTGGKTSFPCKVFFINKVHQMDLLWGTQGPIALQDPLYDIFMHVMANGSMSISVDDSRKFVLKMVGFRDNFNNDELITKFRGLISSHVKDDEEQEKIDSFYNEKRDTAVSTIKNWPAYIGFGVGAAAIAGSFFVGFWLLILAFAGVGYGAFTLLTNKSKRKQIEMSCDESKKATSAAMRQLFAEFKQYQKELDEYDAYHDRILDEIHKV